MWLFYFMLFMFLTRLGTWMSVYSIFSANNFCSLTKITFNCIWLPFTFYDFISVVLNRLYQKLILYFVIFSYSQTKNIACGGWWPWICITLFALSNFGPNLNFSLEPQIKLVSSINRVTVFPLLNTAAFI